VSNRRRVITELAEQIVAVDFLDRVQPHLIRVAIDGVDASGKTSLADELVPLIEECGRPVIRASVDSFHNPRKVRYQRGLDSPEGYYFDSFDYANLLQHLLIPLGPGESRRYRQAVFNLREDAISPEAWDEASMDAILLFDGVFLLRPELIQSWDFSIFVDVDFDVSVSRAVARDIFQSKEKLTPQSVLAKYNQRYIPGQKIYLAQASPKEKADVIIKNNEFENPELIIA